MALALAILSAKRLKTYAKGPETLRFGAFSLLKGLKEVRAYCFWASL